MSNNERVSIIQNSFTEIRLFLDKSKDLENKLNEIGDVERVESFFDELFDLSKKLRETYDSFKKLHNNVISDEAKGVNNADKEADSEKLDEGIQDVNTNKENINTSEDSAVNNSDTEEAPITNKNNNTNSSCSKNLEVDVEEDASSHNNTNEVENETVEDDDANIVTSASPAHNESNIDSNENNNSAIKPENDDIESSISNNEQQTENTSVENENVVIKSEKPLIRLVDLNKLIDPNKQKNCTIDPSVIILSSSDEEGPPATTVQLKEPKDNQLNSAKISKEQKENDPDDESIGVTKHLRKRTKASADKFEMFKKIKINKIRKHSTSSTVKLDKKFKMEVQIPLPLIPCEKLQAEYIKNSDIFLVNSCKTLRSKRKRRNSSDLDDVSKEKKKEVSAKKSKKGAAEKSNTKDNDTEQSADKNTSDSDSDDKPMKTSNISDEEGLNKKKNIKVKKQVSFKDTEDIIDGSSKSSDSAKKQKENGDSDDNSNKDSDTDIEDTKKIKENHNSISEPKDEGEADGDTDKAKKSIDESKNGQDSGSDEEFSDKKKDSDSDDKEIKNRKKTHEQESNINVPSGSDDDKPKIVLSDDSNLGSDIDMRKKKVKKLKKAVLSDSDEDNNKKDETDDDDDDEGNNASSESEENSDSSEKVKKKSRIRIKKSGNSSSESEDEPSTRKKIREVIGKSSLSATTKQAEAEEQERKARIAEKQKKYNRILQETENASVEKVVLDYDEKTKEPLVAVDKKIVKHLKPHQASGIQFMYDACFESVERAKNSPGSGCILAHCMGLGKTLQVISLVHTLLTHSELTGVERVMVVCPINTVLNWKSEFKKWVPRKTLIEVFELATCKQNCEREYRVREWRSDGGVLLIGYNLFRLLSNPNNKKLSKKMRTTFIEGLLDPGPHLVVCDEGHLLKNEKSNLSIAMNRIKTARRIVLTGTPLQNNLKEYWCMVQFIKPNLLGTYKEYLNRFVNPIINGQYTDSTQHDIVLMRKRSHVLHKLLDGVVQRRDYSVLEPYLPPKHEYVLFVKLTEVQVKLYKHYIEKRSKRNDGTSTKTSFLFTDFQELQRICTHPRVLKERTLEKREKSDDEEESEGSLKDFINDDEDSTASSSNSSTGNNSESGGSVHSEKGKKKSRKTRVTRAAAASKKQNDSDSDDEIEEVVAKEWWQEFCDGDELDNINNSGKLSLLFEILKECEEIGDKILIFSQSLYTLNCIEYFLNRIDEATSNGETDKLGGYKGSWSIGLDYFRIDGSSSCDNRAYWCDQFNNPDNIRARLFLISTRAGGLGINLVAANRVIIFDVSWNPSHDLQSIYRVYRFGQTKPCYIYRFVTYGSMEMKIYERQVTKQAISKRVIDEQQIDRHYNQNDLQELYQCDLEPADRPIPLVPKDILLGEMLQKYENIIYKYHLHQSLLEDKRDEGLNEEERKAAWEEFENEKVLRKTTSNLQFGNIGPGMNNMSAQNIQLALMNIVRRDNPGWAENQVRGIIPALVRQLQVQIEENDMSMYHRVVQEIELMNQQRENYFQQQMVKYYRQQMFQKQRNSMLGNLNVNPQQIQQMFGIPPASYLSNPVTHGNIPSTSASMRVASDVIELND